MKKINRSSFIRQSSLAMIGITFANLAGAMPRIDSHRLSFSTLGCPDWSYTAILKFAAEKGYNGIELRGLLRELDLTKCPEFSNAEKIAVSRKMAEDMGLTIVDLGSSAQLHHADKIKRKNNLDEARKFIDLAQRLNCPYIRVFPDSLPKDQGRNATIDLISEGLLELADYAKGTDVSVLLESHGDGVESSELLRIMKNSENLHVGMVWDVYNMWSVTKESPKRVYEQLGKYIRHTHIKDAKITNGVERYVLLGQGEAPVEEAVQSLEQGGYTGFYSFEWEKLWHPDIEEPDIALAQFPAAIKKYFKK